MGHEELQPEDVDVSISALRAALTRTWCAFCNATSIHGLKYTKDKETNRYIRFVWFLIILLMFFCAIAMVVDFYMEYQSNPTRMNVENDHAPISSLLFPPITICSEDLYDLHKAFKFLKTLIMPNYTTVAEVMPLLNYAYGFIYDGTRLEADNIHLLEEILTLNELSILEFLDEMSWDCADLLFRCRFNNKIVPCNQLFYTSRTFRGRCCAFNLNQNYQAQPGLRNGLSVILYYNEYTYVEEVSYGHGFKIFVQESNTASSAFSVVNFVPLDEELFMPIKPMQIYCSQAVKDLSFENRLCVFPTERKLEYFDLYNGLNCESNCRIKNMLKLCNCYTYFYYNKRIKERMCSFKDLPCLAENFAAIIGRFKKTQCPCYRSCEKIEYNFQLTSIPLRLDTPNVDSFYDDIKKEYSVLHIYLDSHVYRRIRQDLLSNMVTLVSNLGSAFSLFVGMSMISVVEIIYYFSVILNKFYQREYRARATLLQRK